jgi:hypothetical protein
MAESSGAGLSERAASYLVGMRNSQDLWIGVSRDLLITTL